VSKRPRPKARIVIDPGNAYARLGVSPLASTEEIKAFINDARARALTRRRSQGRDAFGDEDAEIARLQEIEEEIGTPRARAAYDALYPQNELLTVQPCPRDRLLEPRRRAQLATAWLLEVLGPEAQLGSPDAHELWLPRGLDPALAATLVRTGQSAPDDEAAELALDELRVQDPATGPIGQGKQRP
jgi:hypothetical protein